MKLHFETIIDFYTYKNRNVLCQINFNPKSGKLKNSHRCLSQEDWRAFDAELGKLITTTENWNNEKCLIIVIKPYIEVKVKRSNVSLEHFCTFFRSIGGCDLVDYGVDFILECLFDFQLDVPLTSPAEAEGINRSVLNSMSCMPWKVENYKHGVDTYKTTDDDSLNIKETSEINKVKSQSFKKETSCDKIMISSSSSLNHSNKSNDEEFLNELHKESGTEMHIQNMYTSENRNRSRTSELHNLGLEKKDRSISPKNDKYFRTRAKSEDLFLQTFSKNTKPLYSCQKEVYGKVLKQRARGLDEIPEAHSIDIEKSAARDKISFHKINHKKDCVVQKKKPTNSLRKNELTESFDEKQYRKLKTKHKSNLLELTELCRSREEMKSLRRSERSSSEPKRFVDEQRNFVHLKHSKKQESTLTNKELFGSDNDDNKYFEKEKYRNTKHDNKNQQPLLGTPVNKKAAQANSSCSSKKRRRDNSNSACIQEKRGINEWLSKKKLQPFDEKRGKSTKTATKTISFKELPLKTSTKLQSRIRDANIEPVSESPTHATISLELPSKQELQLIRDKTKLIQTENAKVRAELEKMRNSPPKEVKILSLQNIPLDDILSTFLTYKSELDEIFESNRKKDYIKGHDGINHCFIIRLLQQKVQMKMLEKLTEVYGNSKTTSHATLFANALLPEWVIRVYMNKFNFNRQQAIEQIKAQEEFQLHLEYQCDNSFIFD